MAMTFAFVIAAGPFVGSQEALRPRPQVLRRLSGDNTQVLSKQPLERRLRSMAAASICIGAVDRVPAHQASGEVVGRPRLRLRRRLCLITWHRPPQIAWRVGMVETFDSFAADNFAAPRRWRRAHRAAGDRAAGDAIDFQSRCALISGRTAADGSDDGDVGRVRHRGGGARASSPLLAALPPPSSRPMVPTARARGPWRADELARTARRLCEMLHPGCRSRGAPRRARGVGRDSGGQPLQWQPLYEWNRRRRRLLLAAGDQPPAAASACGSAAASAAAPPALMVDQDPAS